MNEDEKAFETLLGPNLEVRNKQGEKILSLKRKGLKYGQLYYIFEMHIDRVEPENLSKFQVAWNLVKAIAREMKIPLYNIDEVQAGMISKVEEMATRLPAPPPLPFDVKIDISDHATGNTHKLTIGVTMIPLKTTEP